MFTTFLPLYDYGDFFPDAQGQLSPQSMVGSGRISNSCETLWLSSLPCRMKKIQSKIKALECSQLHNIIDCFFRRSRAGNSVVCGWIWLKFKPIQVVMHVLVTCKNKEDPIKNEGAVVFKTCLPL